MANDQDTEDSFELHRSVLAREASKHHKREAKAEAAKENMEEALTAALQQDAIRRALALEARDATRDRERYRRMMEKDDVWASRDRDVPTGYDDNPYVQVDSYSSVDYN